MFATSVTRNSAFKTETQVFDHFHAEVSEMPRNTPKHRMNASQLRYPEIVHCGFNSVEWLLRNFGTQNSAFGPQTQVLHLFTCHRLVKSSETHPKILV
jgi:hypothetical protein